MPVRSLMQSLLRWPEPECVLKAVEMCAQAQAQRFPTLQRVGVYGSCGRGDASVGSDLDLVLIDAGAQGPQSRRYGQWRFEQLPLSCDALVFTPSEFAQLLMSSGGDDLAQAAMARALQQDCRWIWSRHGEAAQDLLAVIPLGLVVGGVAVSVFVGLICRFRAALLLHH